MLIWVDAVDESDPVQGVGVGTGMVRAQALFDPLQFCFAAGGPDDLLDAHIVDAACPVSADMKNCPLADRKVPVSGQ